MSHFTGSTYLPGFYSSLSSINPSVALNFAVGDFYNQSAANTLSNLVDSRTYLGVSADIPVEIMSVIKKRRKGGINSFGILANTTFSAQVDRDLLRIATAGILPEGFGSENVSSRGVSLEAHLRTEVYYHQVREIGKLSVGYRVRLVNPILGSQVLTPKFDINRVNTSFENTLGLSYHFTASSYGFDPLRPQLPSPGISTFFGKYSSFLFDFGFEQQLNSKLKLGLALKSLPGFVRRGEVSSVNIEGDLEYSGINYSVGIDSLSSVFTSLTSFSLDSILPTVVQTNDNVIRIPVRPELTLYVHRYLSEESTLFLSTSLQSNGFEQSLRTSAFIYARSNKLFHLSYGVNWWSNNNSFDATIAGRILLAPYTRLSLGMSNPFGLPRIGPTGNVLVPEKFQGFTIGLGLSFGKYKKENF